MHVHCHRRQAGSACAPRSEIEKSKRTYQHASMGADRPDRPMVAHDVQCSLLLGAGRHSSSDPIHTSHTSDGLIHPSIGQSKAKCLYVPAAYMPPFSQCSQDGAHDGRRASSISSSFLQSQSKHC
jgi:hypothetical protein